MNIGMSEQLANRIYIALGCQRKHGKGVVVRLPCADMQQPIRRRNYRSAIGLYFGTNAFITHHATT